ncbi:MAG: hypothetical protein PHQ23_12995 [Candidatus Wallbacteria bacterium]|nr:hypothetical protein [Candidatus Wallbacteria bacterium]
MNFKAINALVFLAGFYGSTFQIVMIREFMTVFSGSVTAVCFIIGSWVLWEALGSAQSGWISRTKKISAMSLFLSTGLLFSLLAPACVIAFRVLRGAFADFSRHSGFSEMLVWALVFTMLPSLVHGLLLVLPVPFFSHLKPESSLSRVFLMETAGTVIGGVITTYFLLHRFNPVTLAALPILPVLFFTLKAIPGLNGRVSSTPAAASACVAVLLIATFSGIPASLDQWSIKRQWNGRIPWIVRNTLYNNYTVLRDSEQFTVFENGNPTITVPDPDTALCEDIVHFAMLSHPEPRSVLLLGRGSGGILREILKYQSVTRVDYLEIDPGLLELLSEINSELLMEELTDPRLNLVLQDARSFVVDSRTRYDLEFGKFSKYALKPLWGGRVQLFNTLSLPKERKSCTKPGPATNQGFCRTSGWTPQKFAKLKYDVIISAAGIPESIGGNRFFTEEFFESAQGILSQDGVFSLSLPGSTAYYSMELLQLNASVAASLRNTFPQVRVMPGSTNIYLAGGSKLAQLSQETLSARMEKSNLKTSVFCPQYLQFRMNREQETLLQSQMLKTATPANRDFQPAAVSAAIILSDHDQSYALKGLTRQFFRLDLSSMLPLMLAVVLIPALLPAALYRGSLRVLPVYAATAGSGCAGMLCQLLLLSAFQASCGRVFYESGAFISVFMGGIAAGGFATSRALSSSPASARSLLRIEAGFFLLCMLLAALFGSGFSLPPYAAHLLLLPLLLSGILLGAGFITSGNLLRAGEQARSGSLNSAGFLYAADLGGGCVAALCGGILPLTLLGFSGTFGLLALIKLCTMVMVFKVEKNRIPDNSKVAV